MVSTRQQKRSFPSPPRTRSPSPRTPTTANKFVHTPSTAITLWLIFSIPLVLWDSGYVLLRPHSMPGNSLHSPLWTPYALYGTIDYIYGWPAFNARNGFTAAQTVVNLFESAGYCYYLWVVWRYGVSVSAGSGRDKGVLSCLTDERVVAGRVGATALLIAYSASVMTLGKTVLYCELYLFTLANWAYC